MDPKTVIPKLPVIDFSMEDLRPGTKTWFSTCREVCQALEDHGSFVAKCNDVYLDLHNSVFQAVEELFNLPIEVKKLNTNDKPFRGQFSANSVHEGMGIDDSTTLEGVQKFTNLMWPHGNDPFCESAHKMATILREIDQKVIRMVFENYGVLDEKYFESHIGSTDYVLRFSKYKTLQENNYMGLPNHTDKTFTTILHQNHVNGLEIQLKGGQWTVYDPPSHSSFVYLAGEAFKVWSNNRIRPCNHRVTLSGNNGTRHSVGLFTFINGVMHIPEKLVDDEHPLKYKPFDHLQYLKLQMEYAYVNHMEYPVEQFCGI